MREATWYFITRRISEPGMGVYYEVLRCTQEQARQNQEIHTNEEKQGEVLCRCSEAMWAEEIVQGLRIKHAVLPIAAEIMGV